MDLADAFTLGKIRTGATPRVVKLPYRHPPLDDMPFAMETGYTAPAGDAANAEFGKGSIVLYAWLWYDTVPFDLSTAYTAPAGSAADLEFEAV